MMGVLFALWSLVYGVTFGNVEPWAAPVRAILTIVLVLAGLIWMWRAQVRIDLVQALFIGVLATMLISNSFHTTGNYGLAPWLVFAGVYGAQRAARRDWRNDLAAFGMVMSWFMVFNFSLGFAPAGILNRNYVSLLVVLAAPAMIARWPWPGGLMAACAIFSGESRGALVGLAIGMIVILDIPHWIKLSAIPICLAGGLALIYVRPATALARLALARAAISDWWAASPAFGLGPGGIAVEGWRVGEQFISHHAHSVIVSVLTQVGLVGIAIIIIALLYGLATRRQHKPILPFPLQHWQWATLAAAATLSLVEDLAVWWPVGIVIMLASVETSSKFNLKEVAHVETQKGTL